MPRPQIVDDTAAMMAQMQPNQNGAAPMSDDHIILTRRNILALSAIAGGFSVAMPLSALPKLGKA